MRAFVHACASVSGCVWEIGRYGNACQLMSSYLFCILVDGNGVNKMISLFECLL